MRKFTKLFAAVSVALVMAGVQIAPLAATGYDSEKNHPDYWGDNCVKFEHFDDSDYSYSATRADVNKVIIKASTLNEVYEGLDSYTNLSSPINERNDKPFAISHVIECYGEKENEVDEPQTPVDPEEPEIPVDPEEPIVDEPEQPNHDPKDPEDVNNEDDPEVLGTDDGKGSANPPAELPKTGAEPILFVTIAAGVVTYALASAATNRESTIEA